MVDIFNRVNADFGGAFKADQAVLSFGSGSASLLVALTQQLQFQYSQAVTRLYELGSNDIYYVAGRTQGQATMSRVVGPVGSIAAIYARYGDVCNAASNTIEITLDPNLCFDTATGVGATTSNPSVSYALDYCVITQVGISVGAQDMVINDSTTFTFGELNTNDN